jgi:transcriptional regulator with XRE-family HTH domain
MTATNERLTGRELRLLRLSRDVRQLDIARLWGVSRQRVAQLEAASRPGPVAVARYYDALRRAGAGE